jgi:hypothetical protein
MVDTWEVTGARGAGENLPERFMQLVTRGSDFDDCDLLIVRPPPRLLRAAPFCSLFVVCAGGAGLWRRPRTALPKARWLPCGAVLGLPPPV